MSDPVRVDPEFLAILGEITGDPDAKLLRATPAQVRRSLFEHTPRVSSTAPFLKKAERYLLEAYREDVGRLLYRYGYLARVSSPEGQTLHHYGDQEHEPPEQESLRGMTERVLGAQQSQCIDTEAIELLRWCARASAPLSSAQAMVVAMRVAPSHAIRKCLAADLHQQEGDAKGARRILNDILEQHPSSMIESYVKEDLARIACDEGDFELASLTYRAAALCDEERIMPVLFWFTSSVQAEDRNGSIEAARRVEELHAPASPIRWYKSQLVTLRGKDWEPTAGSQRLAPSLRDQLGPTARGIIDAFA